MEDRNGGLSYAKNAGRDVSTLEVEANVGGALVTDEIELQK